MASLLLNVGLFQAGWFASVLGAARGFPWLGPVVVTVVIAVHLARSPDRGAEARLLGFAVSAGILAENLMTVSGLYSAAPWPFPAPFAPLWLPAMWGNFATTVNVSLRGLAPYPLVAALLGAAAGPLAYYAGEALGAVRFGIPAWRGLAALAILWGAAIPGFFALARRLAQASRRPNR